MVEIDLRSAIEYEAENGYAIFMRHYENLCYLAENPSLESRREPAISSFEQYQKILEETNIIFIVSSEDGEIGYLILDVYTSGTAQIKEIMVQRECRRQGYARRAIKLLLENLREDEEIREVTVISASIPTDNFYSSCNFRFVGGDQYTYRLRT